MIANLILIHVLSVIWLTGQVTSVYISLDLYRTVRAQLIAKQPGMGGPDAAKEKYEEYYASDDVGE